MGVDEAIFHNLDYLPDERCNIMRAFYHESPTAIFEQSIDEIHRLGKELNFSVKTFPLKVEENLFVNTTSYKGVLLGGWCRGTLPLSYDSENRGHSPNFHESRDPCSSDLFW